MKHIFLGILFISLTNPLIGQHRKFLIQLNTQENLVYPQTKASNSRLNLENIESSEIGAMFISGINDELERKLRQPLQSDSLLNKICYTGVSTFSTSRFLNRKSWKKEQKSLDYALKLNHSKTKLFVSYAFKFELLDLPYNEKFHCNKRIGESPISLYRGKRPKINNPTHEDYEKPEPLQAMTESQLVEEFMDKLRKQGIMRNILSRVFTQIGIAVRMEKRSLHKNKRPYMYVIVMLAGKQNNYTKKKDKMERLSRLEATYE